LVFNKTYVKYRIYAAGIPAREGYTHHHKKQERKKKKKKMAILMHKFKK
jgi:hypothetical protein